jgi:hypothetical protein
VRQRRTLFNGADDRPRERHRPGVTSGLHAFAVS